MQPQQTEPAHPWLFFFFLNLTVPPGKNLVLARGFNLPVRDIGCLPGVPDCAGGDLREMDLPGGKKKIPD